MNPGLQAKLLMVVEPLYIASCFAHTHTDAGICFGNLGRPNLQDDVAELPVVGTLKLVGAPHQNVNISFGGCADRGVRPRCTDEPSRRPGTPRRARPHPSITADSRDSRLLRRWGCQLCNTGDYYPPPLPNLVSSVTVSITADVWNSRLLGGWGSQLCNTCEYPLPPFFSQA